MARIEVEAAARAAADSRSAEVVDLRRERAGRLRVAVEKAQQEAATRLGQADARADALDQRVDEVRRQRAAAEGAVSMHIRLAQQRAAAEQAQGGHGSHMKGNELRATPCAQAAAQLADERDAAAAEERDAAVERGRRAWAAARALERRAGHREAVVPPNQFSLARNDFMFKEIGERARVVSERSTWDRMTQGQ
eukprot:gene44446-38705_t